MTDKPTMKEILFTADGIKDQPIGEATYSQREVDALLQAANEAALRDAAIQANRADGLAQKIKAKIESLIPEPSALARHDAELRAEFQDEIQALNEQIVQMKAEFAAVMENSVQQLRDAVCCDTETSCLKINEAANELEAAIPTTYADALKERERQARLEEAEWWAPRITFPMVIEKHGHACQCCYCERLAELRRDASAFAVKGESNAKK